MKGKDRKQLEEELRGFEDVLDLFNVHNPLKGGIGRSNSKSSEDFSLFSFLEYEKSRLEKLGTLLSSKLPIILETARPEAILKQQQQRTAEQKEDLVKELLSLNSILNQNFSDIFNHCFKE